MIQLTIYFVFATLNRYNFILYYNGNKILFYTDNVKTAEHQSLAYKCIVPLEDEQHSFKPDSDIHSDMHTA